MKTRKGIYDQCIDIILTGKVTDHLNNKLQGAIDDNPDEEDALKILRLVFLKTAEDISVLH